MPVPPPSALALADVPPLVKRIAAADPSPPLPADLARLVAACAAAPDLVPDAVFKVLFALKISRNPLVAFKAFLLVHTLLADGPAKLTALAITHDGFLSWAEAQWTRHHIPNKPAKPHLLAYCFAAGEPASYMALVRKRVLVHAKLAQVFSTHWVPRPDGLPALHAARRDAFRGILEIVENCSMLLRKVLAAKDPAAAVKQSAVPLLATELAKAYQAMCYICATADEHGRAELRPELTIAHTSTKMALDAVRANEAIAACCQSSPLLQLHDDPPTSFDVQEITSALKKKKKRKLKKKVPIPEEQQEEDGEVEAVAKPDADGREPSPDPLTADEDSSDNILDKQKPPDNGESVDDIPIVDSIEDNGRKPKRKHMVAQYAKSSSSPLAPPLPHQDVRDVERIARRLPSPVAPVVGMEKLSLSIRKGASRVADISDSRASLAPGGRALPPLRTPLPRGRSSSPGKRIQNRATVTSRYRKISGEPSDSDSESPVRSRFPNGNGRVEKVKDLPVREKKKVAASRIAEEEEDSDSSSNEDRARRKTRRARKSRVKQFNSSESESEAASSEESDNDEPGETRQKKRPTKKANRAGSRARKRSPKKRVDEKNIPFDKEPLAKKKLAAKKKSATRVEETDHGGGSKEALAAAASGKKTPTINPRFEVAPYEVQFGPQIGSGGFGVVYKAKFRGETVAVKKIHAHALSNASSVSEFQSEVAVLCTLRHPNILHFVGACTRPPNLMIITEFMARGTLFDVLHQSQMRITWPMRKKFALDTCKGMRYLHASKLLHRDLKSSNLMLDKDFNCKVGDFGLTRISRGAAAVQMTGQCGTFQYMAVEVLANKPYSEKADVFSFGILLWEMVARKLPYFGMQPMQVGIAVLQQGMRPPIPPKCPAPLVKLMRACWDSDPNRRPSFEQLVDALEAMPE